MPRPLKAVAPTASASIQVEDDTAAPSAISEASLTELLEQYDLEVRAIPQLVLVCSLPEKIAVRSVTHVNVGGGADGNTFRRMFTHWRKRV